MHDYKNKEILLLNVNLLSEDRTCYPSLTENNLNAHIYKKNQTSILNTFCTEKISKVSTKASTRAPSVNI